jgi:hypothetical protein
VGPDSPDPAGPPRVPVSHRAPVAFHESVRRLVPPLAAVTAVVVVIVLLLVLNRPDGHTSDAGPALQSPSAVATPSSLPRATTSPTARPSRGPSRTPSPLPVVKPSATATATVAKVPVTVLNNSRRTGLAHRAAAQLSGGGWPIRLVGNFRGRIPESTVYYEPGQARVAAALAHQYPAVRRVLPRFRGLPGSGLTLVVTREWPA